MPSRFELANAVRVLAMDAVQAAQSGHPGAPMGLADVAEVDQPSGIRLHRASEHQFKAKRMPMHAPAFVPLRNVGKIMGRFETVLLNYFHFLTHSLDHFCIRPPDVLVQLNLELKFLNEKYLKLK